MNLEQSVNNDGEEKERGRWDDGEKRENYIKTNIC